MNKDIEHLDLLKIFHYVYGGLGCFFSCIPLIYVAIGIVAFNSSQPFEEIAEAEQLPGNFINTFGWFFIFFGLLAFVMGQVISICILVSAKWLGQRKNYTFSFVIACLLCLNVPLGTVLGIFTIIVLCRPTVKQIYDQQKGMRVG